ncbi:MAG: hypothetical protein KI793_10845 [Rivularia sp. (in: Bacteria)]|nr:hypothetical protein [Rivularia sp. MS3]
MSYSRLSINFNNIFSSIVHFVFNKAKQQKHKIHDYTDAEYGKDYMFESADNYNQGYMTARGKGVKNDDYIILKNGSESYRYQVKEIDYYSNPADMWMALLQKISDS